MSYPDEHSLYSPLVTSVNQSVHFVFTAMQAASKTLFECMSEVYEPEWTGHDLLTVQSQNVEMLWQDLAHKLTDQVLIPLNTYQGQFPEMRVTLR